MPNDKKKPLSDEELNKRLLEIEKLTLPFKDDKAEVLLKAEQLARMVDDDDLIREKKRLENLRRQAL
jgi:hypothetical protein